ncbi:MAG TPA: response regulator [Cyclobacteriaceae bacterium]|nr:response regulator [Cyclobacteriaceae bacterium]
MAQAHYILLAEDDEDDCILFQEALDEISLPMKLMMVNDGEQLIWKLENDQLPDILFLDLNMPRKDGFQCLQEIKQHEKFQLLPIVIFSTSFQPDVINKLYDHGAHYYIRKPSNFEHFKKVIHYAISLVHASLQANEIQRPSKDKFVLESGKFNS